MARRDLKELLLAPEARTEELTPPRAAHRHRETSCTPPATVVTRDVHDFRRLGVPLLNPFEV